MEIGLSLGSNVGNRLAYLIAAKKRILSLAGITWLAQSPVYQTEPIDAPAAFQKCLFLNSILIIESKFACHHLINQLQTIEQKVGRIPQLQPNLPRPLDIDIIYADQLQIVEERLVIPHPRWDQRRFVIQPLSDVRPELHIPGQAATVNEVLAQLQDQSQVVLFATSW